MTTGEELFLLANLVMKLENLEEEANGNLDVLRGIQMATAAVIEEFNDK